MDSRSSRGKEHALPGKPVHGGLNPGELRALGLTPGDKAFVLTPTFGEYEAACRLAGASVTSLPANRGFGFQWDLDRVCEAIRDDGPALVFVCNPNNPTGAYLEEADLGKLVNAVDDGAIVAVDEAYVTFVDGAWDALAALDRQKLVLLRSMTKDYALAGLRLGYGVASRELTEAMGLYQPAWSVNALAQAAGLAALSDEAHLEGARECVRNGKAYLRRKLGDMGLRVSQSSANFLLIEVEDAARVRTQLLHRGVCVRDCTSFGLPGYIRVGIRSMAECRLLVDRLAEVLQLLDGPPPWRGANHRAEGEGR